MRRFLLAMILALFAREGSPAPPDAGPVVIELFTSQGCSSCPPADRLLSRLARDPKLGNRVIPLAFHVDYWNHIGWTDPFSSKRWSERQQGYARAFRSNRLYTPQLVVAGRTHLNGSDEAGVRKRIEEALAAGTAGRVKLSVEPSQDRLKVKVEAKMVRAAEGPLDLWVAVYETGLTTKVGSGENASATLHNDHVVRRLEKVLTFRGEAGVGGSGETVLGLDKRWKRENLGVGGGRSTPARRSPGGASASPGPPS